MTVYLVRHGRDDDSVRGGWSDSSLTEVGATQVKELAERLKNENKAQIGAIFSSDLPRARETADILADAFALPVSSRPEFRETNNGLLAGMKNEIANEKYPGLFWNTLGWDEKYPDGESPHEFYRRISAAWDSFCREVMTMEKDVVLVTHGGVINVILHLVRGMRYSNKKRGFYIPNAGVVAVELHERKENG